MKKVLTMSLALLLLALGWTTPSQAKTVYFQPNSNWQTDGARFALYMFGGASDAWTDFAVVDATNHIYKATFDDSQTNMIFCRMDPGTTENNWSNKWNQTGDLSAPANDNHRYILADDAGWDGATVGSGLTVVTIVMAFGATNATNDTRPFTVETTIAGGVVSWGPEALYDGNKVAITQSSVINNATGKFWGGHAPEGTWNNTKALAALNDFTGITFTDADLSSTSKLNVAANGNAGVKTNLELSFDAQDVGDIVTLYTTASGWNCPLDEITVDGLTDPVIKYAPYDYDSNSSYNDPDGDGFLDTPTFSQLNMALNLFVIKGKLTADKHVTVSSPTTCMIPGSGEQTTKVGFQIAAYRVEEPATLSRTVTTSADAGIEGATITLKAANNVEYSGTTDATGAYSINVYEADLDFTATVEATGYLTREFALANMGGASATCDVTLYTQFGLVGTLPGLSETTDVVMQPTADPNIFTLALNDVVVAAGDYWYKLRADGASNLANKYELPDGSNYNWTFNTDGTYNFLFTFDWTNHTLTFERPIMLSDNTTGITDLNWVDVTIDRTFKAGWNAVVLPFYLSASEVTASFGSNAEVAYYAGDETVNGNVTVTFNKRPEGDIVAGVPYLLWSENEVSGLKFTKDITATQYNTTGTAFDFVGVYTSTVVNAGDYFVYGGQFVKAGSNNTVKPFRAYLQSKGTPARSVTFVIGDDVATDINGLTVEHDYANDAIYNLNGQRVKNPAHRGVYIINGRKVVKM